MPHGDRRFHIDFFDFVDFDVVDHALRVGNDAGTRFSDREAPPGISNVGDRVMHEACSHELHRAGFWPGTGFGKAAFYAHGYADPAPA